MNTPYASVRNRLVIAIAIVRLRSTLLKHPQDLGKAVARIHIVAMRHPRADEPFVLEVVVHDTKYLLRLLVVRRDHPWREGFVFVSPSDVALPDVPLFMTVRTRRLSAERFFLL